MRMLCLQHLLQLGPSLSSIAQPPNWGTPAAQPFSKAISSPRTAHRHALLTKHPFMRYSSQGTYLYTRAKDPAPSSTPACEEWRIKQHAVGGADMPGEHYVHCDGQQVNLFGRAGRHALIFLDPSLLLYWFIQLITAPHGSCQAHHPPSSMSSRPSQAVLGALLDQSSCQGPKPTVAGCVNPLLLLSRCCLDPGLHSSTAVWWRKDQKEQVSNMSEVHPVMAEQDSPPMPGGL
jgi:hypothetical protein